MLKIKPEYILSVVIIAFRKVIIHLKFIGNTLEEGATWLNVTRSLKRKFIFRTQ